VSAFGECDIAECRFQAVFVKHWIAGMGKDLIDPPACHNVSCKKKLYHANQIETQTLVASGAIMLASAFFLD